MKHIHAITLAAASVSLLALGSGMASAQTVSGGDAYQQGYAAGAAAQEKNTLNTYSQAYQEGEQAAKDKLATQQAYNEGYQAGLTQSKQADQSAQQDTQMAYNQGAEDQAKLDAERADRAFDNGYDTGAAHQARADDALYP
jgi:hypothetical protein